ncbi:putative Conserved oligomeric Golgi complex subunit 7 [Hypsibius exemplaris]|uniref:Conserved oligomeric Golgi complex subunit 7 n=1 Tax=Hypsibius exemplaris TaxID=2072580 RepID=A0A1W0WN09_HYPEX|nr:putative Conserved oligomeric Golgi complex subunit 7 [Hypsibius exemplaris]
MDIGATSLSPAEWLNQQFNSPDARQNPEAFSGKLMGSLQQQMYRAQQGMEEASGQLLTLRSSLSHDIPAIRTHSNYLIHDLSDLHTRLDSSRGAANSSLEKIRATEMVKQRMELTYRSLENQDNWEVLLADIKELIGSGDLEAILGRLAALQKCFVQLGESVDHEARRIQLDDVKNNIESFLIPRLVAGLAAVPPWKSQGNARTVGAGSDVLALKIVQIFDLMQRTETLRRILNDCRQRQFVGHWDDLIKALQDDSIVVSIDECIANFYEDLSSSWHAQLPLFAAACGDPADAILHSYSSILTDIGPKLEHEISLVREKSTAAANTAEDFLSALIAIKRSQEAFCQSIEKEYQQSHPRLAPASLPAFVAVVRRPLQNVMTSYVEVELVILSSELSRIHLTGAADKSKGLHALQGSASRLSSAVYSAVVRCFQLTEGKSFDALINMVNLSLAGYVKKVEEFARELKGRTTSGTGTAGKQTDFTDGDSETLNDLVKVLQHCGDLVLQLENIDDMLVQDQIHPGPIDQHILASSIRQVEALANSVFQWTLSLLLRPVEALLEGVPNLSTWTSSATKGAVADIPSFGFDPQDYITRIGNYLLTLPQIMDPVLSSESASMKRLKTILAFQIAPDESTSLTEAWIQATVFESMAIVTAVLTRIKHLTNLGIRQMIADLKYFQNVAEDFAVPLSDLFTSLLDLLTCSREDFDAKVDSVPPVVVNFVRNARNFD